MRGMLRATWVAYRLVRREPLVLDIGGERVEIPEFVRLMERAMLSAAAVGYGLMLADWLLGGALL